MENLTKDQISFAVACLERLVHSRDYKQTQLESLSGVKQSQISKILSRQLDPTSDVVRKLFQAVGLKLEDILHEASTSSASKLLGYLATPLTALKPDEHRELERVVSQIRGLASLAEFAN